MNKVTVADEATDFKRGVDFIGVTVCFIVHDGNGKILLQKRSQQCRDEQGNWDIGGGALEFGERLEDGVRREIYEEYNAEPLEISFIGSYEALRDNGGTPTHWMAFIHAVRVEPQAITIGEPHKVDEIGWFTSDSLPNPLHSQFHRSFDLAKELGIVG